MTDAANSPDPVPTADDTAWPEADRITPSKGEPEAEVGRVVEEGTAVLGTPD